MKYAVCDRLYYVIKQLGQGVIILPLFVKLVLNISFSYVIKKN
jgi:hypothetical protein